MVEENVVTLPLRSDSHVVFVFFVVWHKGLDYKVVQHAGDAAHGNLFVHPRSDPLFHVLPVGIKEQQFAFTTSLNELIRLHHQFFLL